MHQFLLILRILTITTNSNNRKIITTTINCLKTKTDQVNSRQYICKIVAIVNRLLRLLLLPHPPHITLLHFPLIYSAFQTVSFPCDSEMPKFFKFWKTRNPPIHFFVISENYLFPIRFLQVEFYPHFLVEFRGRKSHSGTYCTSFT